ncbi:MAG: FCD domain-containing protein [Nocardioides sp.]|uniref:FadR/GntR family transcriptional regulator n=1 Tax=Nocardioides sp. TaxID=35761 RepID=UPI0039E3DAED
MVAKSGSIAAAGTGGSRRPFEPLNIAPAYRLIYEAIERQIVEGSLRDGEELPSETELAAAFGVTRNTLREGIRLLEQSGYVTRQTGKRLVVTRPHYTGQSHIASKALVMHAVTFRELWEVSLLLEAGSAAMAAPRISDDLLLELDRNVEAMRENLEGGREIITLDIEFHNIIGFSCDNKAMELAREPISLLLYPGLKNLFSHPKAVNAGSRMLEAHRDIVEALRRRDSEAAEAAMHRHMRDFKRGYVYCGIDINAPLDAKTVLDQS